MDNATIALAVCAGYLLLTLALGIIPAMRVSHSVTGYVAADRAMNVVVLYFVLGASVFSSFAFLGAPGWAYSRGAAAFYILAYGVVGMVPLYFFGPRTRRVGERFGFVTQAEMLSHRFGTRSLGVLLALLSVVAFVPYLTLQMKGAGYLLETISGGRVSFALGAGIPYLVVLVYVLYSGVLGVGWTNTFQGVFMMGIAWFLGLYLPQRLYGGVGPMFEAIAASGGRDMLRAPGLAGDGTPWHWGEYSSAVIISAVGISMWPHLFMKSFAARSEREMRLTIVLYPTFQLFLVPILLIGFSAVLAYPGITPADTILPYILTQIELSPILVGLVAAGALAASMSSGDAILHAAASIGIRDGVRPVIGGLSDETERRWIQILVVAIGLVSYYFAVAAEVDIVQLLLGSYGGVAQIFPLVFCAFYWPRATGAGALWGLVAGLAVNTFFLLNPDWKPLPLHEGVYGLLANVAVLVGASLLTAPEPADKVWAYVDAGRKETESAFAHAG